VGALEDRHDEARIDGIEDVGDAVLLAQGGHIGRTRGVDACGHEPVVPGEGGNRVGGPIRIVVGHDHPLEERAAHRDRDDGTADPSGADDEDPHPRMLAAQLDAYFHWNEPV
jgi:hypothetical protein